MRNDNHDLRVSARTSRLTAGSDNEDASSPWQFSGVAVAAGDILHMDDGTRVLFEADELKKAAETQAGEPITKDHPADEQGRPKYPPDVDETFGTVPKAGWVESQQAVGYEATTHDETIAKGVQAGSYDVSVHPFFNTEPYDGAEADVKATDITFGDLSVVSKGDSPSNTATWGPNQALASFTESGDLGSELSAIDAAADDDDDPEGLVRRLARKMGIIGGDGDRRGGVRLRDQTSDGETITVARAGFEDASWMACAHREGDEYDVGPGLGPSIGEGESMDPGETMTDGEIVLDEPLEEDGDVFVALHYASEEGEKLDHITAADEGYFYDRAFVGVAPEGTEVTADADEPSEPSGNEPAESGADADTTSDMPDDNPDGDDNENSPSGDGGTDRTLGDMTPEEAAGELGDALRDQGFVTEDNADQVIEQAQAQASQAEKVDEIIAKSDEYDDDDREDLLASANKVIDREHKRVRGQSAATFPGNAGGAGSLTASTSTDSPDDYGTGVSED